MKKLTTILGTCLGGSLGCLVFLLLVGLVFGASWIVTCGVVYLVTLCFGWTFSWGLGTGVWLITILLDTFFGSK